MPVPLSIDLCLSSLRRSRTIQEALEWIKEAHGVELTQDALRGRMKRAGYSGRLDQYLALDPWWALGGRKLVTNEQHPFFSLPIDDERTAKQKSRWKEAASEIDYLPSDKDIEIPIIWDEPDALETWLIWPDCHIPFENKHCFDTVLEVARELKPYGQLCVGDMFDLLSVSSHPKAPEDMKWQLKDEVDAGRKRRQQLDDLGCKRKVFCKGNHETRGQRLASDKAMGLYESLDADNLFELTANGWEVYGYQEPVRVGKVNFVHDTGFTGKYAAQKNGEAFESSTIQGHSHNASLYYFGNALGHTHVSGVIGWLGSPSAAPYMAPIKLRKNWQLAFAIMRIEKSSGNSHVQLVPFVDEKCVVDGKLYGA